MNAIEMLKKDHRHVDALFEDFESTPAGDLERRHELVQKLVAELRAHSMIEEDVFYPQVKAKSAGEVQEDVRESQEEHLQIDRLVNDLSTMDPSHEQYGAKVHVLKETVQHHVSEEEQEMFPHVRSHLSKSDLEGIGKTLSADRPKAQDDAERQGRRDQAYAHNAPAGKN